MICHFTTLEYGNYRDYLVIFIIVSFLIFIVDRKNFIKYLDYSITTVIIRYLILLTIIIKFYIFYGKVVCIYCILFADYNPGFSLCIVCKDSTKGNYTLCYLIIIIFTIQKYLIISITIRVF